MKIKIDKKVWLIIGIVVFIIALVSLIRIYAQQAKEQGPLKTSMAQQQALWNKLTNDKKDLENDLEEAQSLLDTSRAKFPESVESIEYGEDLFEIADDCNLELTILRPSTPINTKEGAVTYSVASFLIQVQGDVNDILDFVNAIRTGDGFQLPWSAEVEGITIDFGDAGAIASITANIYGYKG
jgi:hypothetical protein